MRETPPFDEAVAALLEPDLPSVPTPRPMRPVDWRWFWAIVGLAAILRLGYFVGHSKTVYAAEPTLDARHYFNVATAIANDEADAIGGAFDPPAYPYLLGHLYRILNEQARLSLTYLIQHAIGVATVVLVFLTAFHLGGIGPAAMAALATATFAPLAAFENEALPVSLIALGFIAVVFFLVLAGKSRSIEYVFVAGWAFALCALAYPGIYMFLPVAVIRLFALPAPERLFAGPFRLVSSAAPSRPGRWVNPVAFLLGPAVTALFYGIATDAKTGGFTPFPARGGVYFYLGNGPTANGVFFDAPMEISEPGGALQSRVESFAISQYARRLKVRGQEVRENPAPWSVSAFWYGEALSWMRSHPRLSLSLLAKKLMLALSQVEGSNHTSYSFCRHIDPFARWWPSTYGAIVILAVLGLRMVAGVPWTWPRHWLWLFVASQWGCQGLFFVDAGTRAPVVPVLSIVAALGAQRAWHLLSRRTRRPRALRMGVPAAVALSVAVYGDWFRVVPENEGLDWWRYASAAYQAQEWDTALRACNRAIETGEENALLYVCRGDLYKRQNAFEKAEADYRRAIYLEPSQAAPYYGLAQLFIDRKEYDRGAACLMAAINRSPKDAAYLAEFGVLAMRAGDVAEAENRFRMAHAHDPNNITALVGLAEIEGRRGDSVRERQLRDRAYQINVAETRIETDRVSGKPDITSDVLKVEPFSIYKEKKQPGEGSAHP